MANHVDSVKNPVSSNFSQKLSTFFQYINKIEEWNKICANQHLTFDEAYLTQKNISFEEIKETIDALDDKDLNEFVDGVCDIIVTASYLASMNRANYLIQPNFGELNTSAIKIVLKALNDKIAINPTLVDFEDVFQVYHLACEIERKMNRVIPGLVKNVDNYMTAVLESNDSKIIKVNKEYKHAAQSTLAQEEIAAVKKYGEQWPDIVTVKSKVEDKDFEYYVLRANNGAGKILKPLMYQHPIFYYHD